LGRIYDARIKKIGDELVEKYQDSFGIDFHENKKIVSERTNTKSKFIKNKIAGYVTSKMRKMKGASVEPEQESQVEAEKPDSESEEASQ